MAAMRDAGSGNPPVVSFENSTLESVSPVPTVISKLERRPTLPETRIPDPYLSSRAFRMAWYFGS